MAKVNPPPFLKTPKEFLKNKETRSYFQAAEFMWFQLWKRSGGGTDAILASNQFVTTNQAELNSINQRLGSGNALTSDETGFTVDSTALTVDMTEA